MIPKIRVEFRILGTRLSPDEITEMIGVTPTRTWKLGEPIEKTALRRKHNGWCLSADCSDLDLAKSASNLLQILLPRSKKIIKVCKEYELYCELSYAIYMLDNSPPINFSQDVISGLARLNATLDIDIIFMAE